MSKYDGPQGDRMELRLPSDLKNDVAAAARADSRSANSWTIRAMIEKLKRDSRRDSGNKKGEK